VVAAIVKFTPEQSRKIAEKEEQRQSLVSFSEIHKIVYYSLIIPV
jgi:hypothetical protein